MTDSQTDPLSSLGHQILNADASAYRTLVIGSLADSATAIERLDHVSLVSLFATTIRQPGYALLSLGGLWLWHDALDRSHTISQMEPDELTVAASRMLGLGSALQQFSAGPANAGTLAEVETLGSTIAFWHAIIHRREGDFSNSKYWYRRCTDHPIYATLALRIEDLTRSEPADKSILKITANGFNPGASVDFVERVKSLNLNDPQYRLAVMIQQAEWRSLFDFCTRAATR